MKDISKKHKLLLMTQIVAAGGVILISVIHLEYLFNPIYQLIDVAAFFSLNQFDNYVAYFLEVALDKKHSGIKQKQGYLTFKVDQVSRDTTYYQITCSIISFVLWLFSTAYVAIYSYCYNRDNILQERYKSFE